MKIKKLILVITILLAPVTPVRAENWKLLTTSLDGTEFYLDIDSITKEYFGNVYFWRVSNFQERSKSNALSSKIYSRSDCDTLAVQLLKTEFYDGHFGKGKLISSNGKIEEWFYPLKGALENIQAITKEACTLVNN